MDQGIAQYRGYIILCAVLSLLAGGVIGYFTPHPQVNTPIIVSTPLPTPTPPPTPTLPLIRIHVSGAVRQPAVYKLPPGSIVQDAVDAVPWFDALRDMPQEAFAVLELNGANKAMGPARVVTLGILNSNQVHPREVFADAIKHRASSVIVAHTHPSGTLEASPEDRAITSRLAKAGKILGVQVLDHIIVVSGDGYLSLREKGLL